MTRTQKIRLATKLKRVAERRGYRPSFRLCYRLVDAARDTHVPVARLAALVEKESGYRFIFGHDVGGMYQGARVTEWRYKSLRETLRRGYGGANGVGYVQVTWPPYIIANGDLWKPKANLRWGARNLDPNDLNAYNGDPSGEYGRDLRRRINEYRQALR